MDAWADRTRELSALGAVEHVFCFENRGKEIGVTLHHPHGQIYAYPFLPARTAQILRQATEHHDRTGRLMGADLPTTHETVDRKPSKQAWVAPLIP